ncbi:MAG TPA: HAD-IA family hydrolase [bacterium]|jgi:putative hydrolase of the HAD superfamily|nr:HAD-IA family hydrolase [bacterium]
MKGPRIQCLFLDIGGVLMSNGWDRAARGRAAVAFKLDLGELEDRNHLVSGAYEEGKLSLDDYLDQVVFHKKRPFSRETFTRFMHAQSACYPSMLSLVARLKARHRLKVAVVSNEGRELNAHRVRLAGLDRLADCFVSSSFVHLRKPDPDIYRLALDLVQTAPSRVLYVENTALFIKSAAALGIRGILHKDEGTTRRALASFGLD